MLVLDNVTGRDRHSDAITLHGISFQAEPGEIIGVIGAVRSGKTALMRVLAGRRLPATGTLRLNGAANGRSGSVVGYAGEAPLLPSELTGVEWLQYLAGHRCDTAAARMDAVREALEIGELEGVGRLRIGTYPRDVAQRLAVAGAVLAGTRLVVLDDVFRALDPIVSERLADRIARLAATGRLVVLSGKDLNVVERVATRVLILRGGRLMADVHTASLRGERVLELTLAGSALPMVDRLRELFPATVRSGTGASVPLTGGMTGEHVLATCLSERIPIAASHIRYRVLEDLLRAAHFSESEPGFEPQTAR